MALVLSESTEDKVNESCDASNGQGCQRRLTEQDDGQQDVPPEFVPTHEWQDILPNQVIPPVATRLLTAVRVRAHFDERASGGKCTLVPVRRRQGAVNRNAAAAPPMFEPTHEWKEILPNQVLPAGLHIRVNLQTGKKEAKLLD
ncbi:hypothetical protein PHYSODRAFT_310868 [Phytophthora sojae]|uniref:Uncharacterized protein n=1 Tax=Phytophthora sojae (strain P6497) TaxID=1094619 RepID=G4YTJ0_PHYSP|nr:hypothetical protein PHYSODRAFT_310868 [Phytophthora sojae]EGZ23589.1 hypothetical protein PHYSODRAFT_310868 [Phytophthora sojae]|eukprot:XP_009518877.1 hypothetical protein PHYSODRAFT_310868 [Phytophthora sojae]